MDNCGLHIDAAILCGSNDVAARHGVIGMVNEFRIRESEVQGVGRATADSLLRRLVRAVSDDGTQCAADR